ncbi:uncharacterized protein A4U43_C03F15240 [Asparagus officinalis]|uniref:Succinate dehydrogenase subunit 3 n=1 Tax=Asparagus officinalis TaxID=4686 RepID=A0A5P1FAT1_ASPOF|nr:succinate dehydrogenase subunit 3-1, mitochondrial-like [Asparagus officinalis]ONK75282.1 uncharacterized protein A4U43_C03F15240 [Asparagus officinalis]
MDAPFALRGYLSDKDSKSRLEHKTPMTMPKGSFFHTKTSQQPSGVPHGSRALHGTQALSSSPNGASSNRPLSPHLALKKPQLSATYSISHRIFGAALASAIMLSPIALKFKTLLDV